MRTEVQKYGIGSRAESVRAAQIPPQRVRVSHVGLRFRRTHYYPGPGPCRIAARSHYLVTIYSEPVCLELNRMLVFMP